MARGKKKEIAQPPALDDENETSSSSAHQDDESSIDHDEEVMNTTNPTLTADNASKDDESSIDLEDSSTDSSNANTAPPPISKSWAALTTHSPCYTGGNVLFSSPSSISNHNNNNQDEHLPHFILAQRGGDVSIIEASTGLLLRTLRRGMAYHGSGDDNNNEDNDDDEEVMDAEAITAFDLNPNNQEVIVVTRGHLVRRYSLVDGDGDQSKSKKGGASSSVVALTNPAPVSTIGKSGHTLPVTKIAHHPSGIFFATGSVDGLVKIWDSRNNYATHAFLPMGGGKGRYAVTCLQWRQVATCLVLAIGREDGSISIHDLMVSRDKKANNVPLAVLRDHVSAVTCISWAESGGLFFSSGRDSVINTWLISEEEEVVPPRKKKKSQDGGIAKTVSTKKVTYTRIRTLPVYEQVESLILLSRRYRPASESKGQQEMVDRKDIVLATVGTKGIVRLWKARPTGKEGVHSISDLSLLASQNEIDAFGEDKGGYTSLHLTSLSTTHLSPLLVAVDAEHNMTLLKMGWGRDSSGEEMLQIRTDRAIVGDNGEILDMAVIPGSSKDRHTVAVATNSAQVRIFGLADANKDEIADDETTENSTHSALSPRGLLDGHTAIVLAINASPCGRYLATAGKDKTMRLWHLASRKCIGLATGHTEAVGSVALSKKAGCYDVGGKAAENGAGAFVVTASKDRTLKVWPLPGSAVLNKLAANGEELSLRARLSARAHEKDINIVSVAPNDSLIATGSQDKTVKLWRSTDLALQATLKGHKRGIWDCQFSKTDRVLATASGDRTIKLWSIADSSCVRTFQGHMAGVLRVRFLATGLQLLSCGSDGLMKLWTIRTNECESTIDAHDDKIWALDLSPCGTALFSGGADSKIAVWRDTTKENDDAVREAEAQNILMEQKLSNHLRNKQYEEALEIALKLDKPNQVLRVLTEIVEKDTKNNRGVETLQKHALKWDLERLTQILKYCREWNTRARNSHIAMLVVKAVVTTIPSKKLSEMDGIPQIMAGIAPYAERHFDRLDRMVENSYLMDFTLFSMGSLHGTSDETYSDWVARSKYVLPPSAVDGRIQVGGSLLVGATKKNAADSSDDSSNESVVTVGESDSSEDEDSSSSD
ncbi:hypothetical protein ACHAWO_013600 [Cyclotella atomus]|uniref:U3 small nucleolar RNA-associated protein 13 C-terminal domain-containing protein n=1 Tax=Cyclotella atomus TaxID=382360 RepID=A0ABD3PT01_9STRA